MVLPAQAHLDCPACLERTLAVTPVTIEWAGSALRDFRLEYSMQCACGFMRTRRESEGAVSLNDLVASYIHQDAQERSLQAGSFERPRLDGQ